MFVGSSGLGTGVIGEGGEGRGRGARMSLVEMDTCSVQWGKVKGVLPANRLFREDVAAAFVERGWQM